MLPASYIPSTLRVVTPVCERTGRIGVAFDQDFGLPSGAIPVRIALGSEDAATLCRLLQERLAAAQEVA